MVQSKLSTVVNSSCERLFIHEPLVAIVVLNGKDAKSARFWTLEVRWLHDKLSLTVGHFKLSFQCIQDIPGLYPPIFEPSMLCYSEQHFKVSFEWLWSSAALKQSAKVWSQIWQCLVWACHPEKDPATRSNHMKLEPTKPYHERCLIDRKRRPATMGVACFRSAILWFDDVWRRR